MHISTLQFLNMLLYEIKELLAKVPLIALLISNKPVTNGNGKANTENLVKTDNNSSELVRSYLTNPDISCYVEITPYQTQYDTSLPPNVKKGLMYLYENDCNPNYQPENFIYQYDKSFSGNCQQIKEKLYEVSDVFQDNLDAYCHKILAELPSDYQDIFDKGNKSDILAMRNIVIPTYHKIKCLLEHYDINGKCPNDCNYFVESVLQSFEPIVMESVKGIDEKSKVVCNDDCKRRIYNFKNHGISALNDIYKNKASCLIQTKKVNDEKCRTYSRYKFSDCSNHQVADFYEEKRRDILVSK